jgi:hypothetical protein
MEQQQRVKPLARIFTGALIEGGVLIARTISLRAAPC